MGGFFGLELARGRGMPHPESEHCAYLSSGRAAFECLLRGHPARITRLHVPRFTCNTVLEAPARLGIAVSRYRISEQLEPLLPPDLMPGDALLLTDYFGFGLPRLPQLLESRPDVHFFVNATTAFFTPPPCGLPSFYSPRKFMGVADGGIARAPYPIPLPEEEDRSAARSRCLLERLELGAAAALPASEEAEASLSAPARRMAPLTRRLLAAADCRAMAEQRIWNYRRLHRALAPINRLTLPDTPPAAPCCYPLLSGIPGLRDALIDAGVALPLFWPEVLNEAPADSTEYRLAAGLLPLPLDQRYSPGGDMEALAALILEGK